MRMETFIRKQLTLKAHSVPKVEETPEEVVVWIDRLGQRPLRCGRCGIVVRQVHSRSPLRRWRHLALGETPCWLVYRPFRVRCPACGIRVARTPWADLWQRVTHALFRAVASLTRVLDWSSVAAHFQLNWKTVAAIVEGAVLWGLHHRPWQPLHVLGIDEVSRRKGQQDLTLVYDLERGRVLWVGQDRTAATMQRFFAWLGSPRASAIQVVCCDMWAVYIDAVYECAILSRCCTSWG